MNIRYTYVGILSMDFYLKCTFIILMITILTGLLLSLCLVFFSGLNYKKVLDKVYTLDNLTYISYDRRLVGWAINFMVSCKLFVIVNYVYVVRSKVLNFIYRDNRSLEIYWTLFPVIILLCLLGPSLYLLFVMDNTRLPVGEDFSTYFVGGHQWFWEYKTVAVSELSFYYYLNESFTFLINSDVVNQFFLSECVFTGGDNGKNENGKTENGKTENGKTENGKTENGKTENGKTENGKTEDGKPKDDDENMLLSTLKSIYYWVDDFIFGEAGVPEDNSHIYIPEENDICIMVYNWCRGWYDYFNGVEDTSSKKSESNNITTHKKTGVTYRPTGIDVVWKFLPEKCRFWLPAPEKDDVVVFFVSLFCLFLFQYVINNYHKWFRF